MRTVVALWLGAALVLSAAGCAREHDSPAQGDRDAASPGPDGVPLPDAKGHVGAQAFVTLDPIGGEDRAPELPFEGGGTLAQTAGGVDLRLNVDTCDKGASYQLVILAGSDCSEATLRGSA
ncbi:MAG TPA: hypothetical protein VFZ61_34820, partial [Polyangiales bacterium]